MMMTDRDAVLMASCVLGCVVTYGTDEDIKDALAAAGAPGMGKLACKFADQAGEVFYAYKNLKSIRDKLSDKTFGWAQEAADGMFGG